MGYDPEKHHRRSIRLKGHDYGGRGVYFVTLCAHRELVEATRGKPFKGTMREIIKERIRITEEKFPDAQWLEWVIMPDHFHALIRMEGGHLRLGDIVGGFKSAVSREWRRGNACVAQKGEAGREGEAGLARTPRIWHRNYYEVIVRSPEAEKRIAEYIRMNPWRCVQELGGGLKGMGNPALWNLPKLGICCSRNAPRPKKIPQATVFFGGFHSPMEKEIFEKLIELKRPLIWCPAWGLEGARQASPILEALEGNRMLILEMRNHEGNLAAAEQRNRFVLENAERLFIPYVASGGMLERLLKEYEKLEG